MMQKFKNYFIILLCVPILFLCSCSNFKPKCKEIPSVGYYFEDEVSCDYFQDLETNTISINNLTDSKLNKSTLNPYAKFTLKAKSAEIYHLYIEYIYFKVYTSESSEYEMNVNVDITNVIDENEVGKENPTETEYSNTYSCITKKNNVAIFKIYVNKVVRTATGLELTIDILNNETYLSNPETNLKWTIFDFKIYGESRAY